CVRDQRPNDHAAGAVDRRGMGAENLVRLRRIAGEQALDGLTRWFGSEAIVRDGRDARRPLLARRAFSGSALFLLVVSHALDWRPASIARGGTGEPPVLAVPQHY